MTSAVGRRWLGSATLVLLGGWGACALAVPESRRPALVLAAVGAIAVVVAVATGWRVVGSLALVLVTSAPLMAGALEPSAARPGRLLAVSVLLLVMIVGLDGVERERRLVRDLSRRWRWVRVNRPPVRAFVLASPVRRWSGAALAIATTGAVAAAASAPVEPSLLLVLVGLVAGLGAVLLAIRLH